MISIEIPAYPHTHGPPTNKKRDQLKNKIKPDRRKLDCSCEFSWHCEIGWRMANCELQTANCEPGKKQKAIQFTDLFLILL